MSLWHLNKNDKNKKGKGLVNMGIDLFVDQVMETKKQQPKEKTNKVKIFKYTTTMTETTSDVESIHSISSNNSEHNNNSNSSGSNKKRQYKNISRHHQSPTSPITPITLFPSTSSTRSSISGRSVTSSYSVSTKSSSTTTSNLSHHSNRSSTSYFSTDDLFSNKEMDNEVDYCYSDDDESIKKRNFIDHDVIHHILSKSYPPPEGYSNASLTNSQSYPLSWRPHFVIFTIGEASCEHKMMETLFNCKINKELQECTYKWVVDNRRALVTICRLKHDKNDQKYILHLIQRLGISSILIFIEMKAMETIYKSLDKLFDILAPFKSKKDINAWIQRLFFIFDQYEMDKTMVQRERQHILQQILPTITKRYELLLRPSVLFLNSSITKRSKRTTSTSSTKFSTTSSTTNTDNVNIPLTQKKIYQLYCKRILWTILTTYPKRWRTLAPYIPDESIINTDHQQYQLSPTNTTTNNNNNKSSSSSSNNNYHNVHNNNNSNNNNNSHNTKDTKKHKNNNKNVIMVIPTNSFSNIDQYSSKNINDINKKKEDEDDDEDDDDDDDDEEFSVFNFATVIHKGGYKSPPIVKVQKKLYDNSQLYGRDEKVLVEKESNGYHHHHSQKNNNNTTQHSDKPHTSTSPSKKLTLTTYDKNERPHAFF